MNQKTWSLAGLFMAALVISIPFCISDAYAATVRITKNHGQDGIDKFIDGQGDTWTLEALISNYPGQIQSDYVKLDINDLQLNFTACSSSEMGGTVCSKQTPLPDGMSDRTIPFIVQFNPGDDQASDSDSLHVDGTAPQITSFDVKQSDQEVLLSFNVRDQPSLCTGIQSIELLKEGNVVYTVEEDFPGCEFSSDVKIPHEFLSGAGSELMKLRVRDKFGHETYSNAKRLRYDFSKPQIQSEVTFEKLEDFIGQSRITTSMKVDIIEEGSLQEVIADSDTLNFRGSKKATCSRVSREGQEHVHECTWTNVEISPEQAISVTVTATDSYGNSNSADLHKRFTPDDQAPVVTFVTDQLFGEGENLVWYTKTGPIEIIAQINEIGAGVEKENIFGDFTQLRGGRSNPTLCGEIGDELFCSWEASIPQQCSGGEICRINAYAIDNVGNEGEKTFAELHIDKKKPKVVEIEMTELATGRNFFQSRDNLLIGLKIDEESGLRILVDLNDVLTAEENPHEEGKALFTEDNCQRDDEGYWVCGLETEQIKSGYERKVDIPITVMDTGGNEATEWPEEATNLGGQNGNYHFELLGLDEETDPDFWETGSVTHSIPFIDLDTTNLIASRMDFQVNLNAKTSNVYPKLIQLLNCEQETEGENGSVTVGITRRLAVNTIDSKNPLLIIEFEPFDGKEKFAGVLEEAAEDETFRTHDLVYNCSLSILSRRGNDAVSKPEMQSVMLEVPFGFSQVGAPAANLDDKIKQAKEDMEGWWGFIGVLAKIVKAINYILQAIQLLLPVVEALEGTKEATDTAQAVPVTKLGAIAACLGLDSASQAGGTISKNLQYISGILSCNYQGNWILSKWMTKVFEIYNDYQSWQGSLLSDDSGDQAAYQRISSPQSNLFVSAATGCLTGVVMNLNLMREVKCRYIYCLENEVRAGITTVDACAALEDVLMCKYVLGELWELIPFTVFYEKIIEALQDAVSSPLSLARAASVLLCAIHCLISGSLSSICKAIHFLWDALDYLESLLSFVENLMAEFEDKGGGGYCSAVGL